MIYLVTVHNSLKMLAILNDPAQLKTKFWESVEKLTLHKTVLYSPDVYRALSATPMKNRVNIMFSPSNDKTHKIPNILMNNNVKDIIASFKNSKDDIYVLCTNKNIMEYFAKDADFIIDYTTSELECTDISIFDTINFADYTLLKTREFENFVIRYFVRENTNFIGY